MIFYCIAAKRKVTQSQSTSGPLDSLGEMSYYKLALPLAVLLLLKFSSSALATPVSPDPAEDGFALEDGEMII